MIIYAVFQEEYGFCGLFTSIDVDKSLSREFIDVVICNGEQNGCDLIAKKAGSFDWAFNNIMNCFDWDRVPKLDDYDGYFNYFAFKEFF